MLEIYNNEDSLFQRIYNEIERLPVIDCHEHVLGPKDEVEKKEPIAHIIQGYIHSDLISAGLSNRELGILDNNELFTEDKWEIFKWSEPLRLDILSLNTPCIPESYSLPITSRIPLEADSPKRNATFFYYTHLK